ncbi:MAG: MaoC family dehydratase [Lachnospiraceae bacterium]|nr:MaoC family dehydratase [Parasporobacterium sp.]MBR4168441.1 MaoC family dehydratase [Lachnospiraceae bacterium]MCR4684412.1 MaoC family dehydratase [Lachnospiraceae bacterium]
MNSYTYDEIVIGQTEQFCVTVTEDMQDAFRKITGDLNPLHGDAAFAKRNGHGGPVVFGMLTMSFLSTLAGMYLPGKNSLIQGVSGKLRKPVYIGDTLTVEGVVSDKSDAVHVIGIKYSITNQDGVKVAKGEMQIGVENYE